MVTAIPAAATSHHRARCVVQARQAPANVTAEERAIRFGFQMNVDPSTAVADTQRSRAAAIPASGPAIARASHQVTVTATTPDKAISPATQDRSPPPGQGEGAKRET